MKRKLEEIKHKLSDFWRQRMHDSDGKKMNRGAIFINRIISWARGDSWRQNHPHNPNKTHSKKKH